MTVQEFIPILFWYTIGSLIFTTSVLLTAVIYPTGYLLYTCFKTVSKYFKRLREQDGKSK